MTEVKFKVGEVYKNRLGEYKVLKVDQASGKMEVRYLESGDSKNLDITIQSRICKNMQLDARIEQAARQEEATAEAKAAKAATRTRSTTKKAAVKKTSTKKTSTKKSAAAEAPDSAEPTL